MFRFEIFNSEKNFLPSGKVLKPPMVLILDGNSEIGAHVKSNLSYLFCIRHLIKRKELTNPTIISDKTYFPSCVRNRF